MDNGQLLDAVIKGSSALSYVRKINRVMNVCRVISYAAVGIVLVFNMRGIISIIRR